MAFDSRGNRSVSPVSQHSQEGSYGCSAVTLSTDNTVAQVDASIRPLQDTATTKQPPAPSWHGVTATLIPQGLQEVPPHIIPQNPSMADKKGKDLVEHSNEGLENLPAVNGHSSTPHVPVNPALQGLLEVVFPLLSTTLTQQQHLLNERQGHMYALQRAQKSRVSVEERLNEARNHDSFKELHPDFANVCQEWKISHQELESWEQRIRTLEDNLSNLSYRLLNYEYELLSVIKQSPLYSPVLPTRKDNATVFVSPKSDMTVSSASTHPLTRQFYDRIGDVRIWQDRIRELELEHIYEKENRDTLRQLDQPLQFSDIEFTDRYTQERNEMLQELSKAQDDVRRLRQQCLESGISLDSTSDEQESKDTSTFTIPQPTKRQSSSDSLFLGLSNSNVCRIPSASLGERINLWLDESIKRTPPEYLTPFASNMDSHLMGLTLSLERSEETRERTLTLVFSKSPAPSQYVLFPSSSQESRDAQHSHLSWKREPPQSRLSDPGMAQNLGEGWRTQFFWTAASTV